MSYKPVYKVIHGSELTLDGLKWRVVAKDRDGYIVDGEEGEQTVLSFERVDAAIKSGTCEVASPKDIEKRKRLKEFTGDYERLDQLPEQEQRNARARQALVMGMEQLEKAGQKLTHRYLDQLIVRKQLYKLALKISENPKLFDGVDIGPTRPLEDEPDTVVPKGRTLAKLLDVYRSFGRNPVVLINRHHKKGCHDPETSCRLSAWQIQFVTYVLNKFMVTTQPKLVPIYESAIGLMPVPEKDAVRGIKHPSITTVRNWKNGLSHLAREIGRLGFRHAKNKHGAGATDLRGLIYGERAAMDQVYLSIFVDAKGSVKARVIDPNDVPKELEANEVMRVWLHVMIDVTTRLPLAWILSESAHSDQTNALLRMATRDKTKEKIRYGCKQVPAPAAGLLLSVADNGTAIRNAPVYSSKLGLNMMVQTGRTYHSNDNPHVERIFGTIQWDVLNFEGGYVGSRPGELPGYDPKANTRLTPNDLYGVLTRYFVDEYSHTPHRGAGMYGATPYEKLEQTIEQYGAIDPPNPEARRMFLGIKKTVSTTSEGVLAFNIPFNSNELQKHHDGKSKKVNVYVDPDFLHVVTIQPIRSKSSFHAKLSMTAFKDLTLEETMQVMEDTALANPGKRKNNNEMVSEARADRARRSGFFSDPNLPESYRTLAQLEQKAGTLSQISFVPDRAFAGTAVPGSIMQRPERAAKASCIENNYSLSPAPTQFIPIEKSKL